MARQRAREERSVAPSGNKPLFYRWCEKNQGSDRTLCALCDAEIWNEPPPLLPPSPPSLERGPRIWREILTIMKWGWVFEKSRLLQALKFDKRWLKYTIRMEDCSYLCFLDDYRVCVKKRNFYRPPSDATSGDAWRCGPAYVLAEAFLLVDTIFTSTAGKGPDRRRCQLVRRIRDRWCLWWWRKKFVALATGF